MCVCADLGVPAYLCGLAALRSTAASGRCRARAMLHRQSPKIMRWKAARPPGTEKNKEKKALSRAGKVHKCTLPAFTCCITHLGKPCLAQIRPILASFGRFMGPKRLKNCALHPPNIDKDASKSPQKWGLGAFWTIWRPFLSLLYRFPKE